MRSSGRIPRTSAIVGQSLASKVMVARLKNVSISISYRMSKKRLIYITVRKTGIGGVSKVYAVLFRLDISGIIEKNVYDRLAIIPRAMNSKRTF